MTTDAQLLREQRAKALSRRDAMIIGMDGTGISREGIMMKLVELGYAIGLNAIGRVISAERRAHHRQRDPRAFLVVDKAGREPGLGVYREPPVAPACEQR